MTSAERAPASLRFRHGIGILFLLGLIAFCAQSRIQGALKEPNFDAESARGMLRSDPGLLYYFVERILEADGGVPDDFDRDPRVAHPITVSLLEDFTIAQEFVVAWCYRWFGDGVPLHMMCVYVMAIFASLSAVGVYWLSLELTGKVRWAVIAAALFVLVPANYRTNGFILIREDFSVPWFALHLGVLATALRRPRVGWFLASGVALTLALSSWHAMGFVVTLEVATAWAWFLRTGRNPFTVPRSWVLPLSVALLSLFVPVLRSKWLLLSLPMQLTGGLVLAAWWARRNPGAPETSKTRLTHFAAAVSGTAGMFLISFLASRWSGAGLADYSHVVEFLLAKIRTLGQLPRDPNSIPFGARLLWQGPFDTNHPVRMYFDTTATGLLLLPSLAATLPFWTGWERGWLPRLCSAVLVAIAFCLLVPLTTPRIWCLVFLAVTGPAWFDRRDRDPRLACLTLFALVCVLVAYLVNRNIILCGLLLPTLAVTILFRMELHFRESGWQWFGLPLGPGARSSGSMSNTHAALAASLAAALAFGVQGYFFQVFTERANISWYQNRMMLAEIRQLVDWLDRNEEVVPRHEAILSDFTNSTAVLAHTRHPIVLQPKYETAEARRRAEEYFTTMIRGTLADVCQMLDGYECRFLLVDRRTVWDGFSYIAGIPAGNPPPPDSAIRTFYSQDSRVLESVPGLQLVYRSPQALGDLYRLYRRVPGPE